MRYTVKERQVNMTFSLSAEKRAKNPNWQTRHIVTDENGNEFWDCQTKEAAEQHAKLANETQNPNL